MGERWLERKTNWLKNYGHDNNIKEKPQGRPVNKSRDYSVRFIPLRCPKCRSKDVLCYKTDFPIRYHTCRSCKWKFKSVESE